MCPVNNGAAAAAAAAAATAAAAAAATTTTVAAEMEIRSIPTKRRRWNRPQQRGLR